MRARGADTDVEIPVAFGQTQLCQSYLVKVLSWHERRACTSCKQVMFLFPGLITLSANACFSSWDLLCKVESWWTKQAMNTQQKWLVHGSECMSPCTALVLAGKWFWMLHISFSPIHLSATCRPSIRQTVLLSHWHLFSLHRAATEWICFPEQTPLLTDGMCNTVNQQNDDKTVRHLFFIWSLRYICCPLFCPSVIHYDDWLMFAWSA